VSDDRSPIGIVNQEAADRRRQRRKGHIQIIEEDRKRLKMENDRLTAENAALREWASPILRWVKDVRCTRDTVADLWFWLEAHVRTCPAAIDAGKDGE
jgi:hypothetical protein